MVADASSAAARAVAAAAALRAKALKGYFAQIHHDHGSRVLMNDDADR